jgi:hypothetical protein
VVDVTDKPIEFTAAEIIKFITSKPDMEQRQPVPY